MSGVLKVVVIVLVALVLSVSSFLGGLGLNYYLQQPQAAAITLPGKTPTTTTAPAKFAIMWEAWRLIKNEYYGDVPTYQALVHGMIRGMLASLGDSHTILEEPQTAQIEQNNLQGSYGGIGASVEVKDGNIVLLPFPDGPAARAGVRAEDILLRIDDKNITPDMTTNDVQVALQGDVGSTVKLTLHRIGDSQPNVISIQRAKINIPSVQYRMLQNTNIAYIQVTLESSDTAQQLQKALDALSKNNPTGAVLDLRNNPGGEFPDPVIGIAGEFLPDNALVVHERYRDGTEKTYTAKGGGRARTWPLVVLVNGGTASDAEILAGAFQDSGRAILLGEKTFGKGSVQEVKPLSDKSVVHITVATWTTPKNNEIDSVGLKPDLAIPLTPEDAAKGNDPQLDRAIQYLKTGS